MKIKSDSLYALRDQSQPSQTSREALYVLNMLARPNEVFRRHLSNLMVAGDSLPAVDNEAQWLRIALGVSEDELELLIIVRELSQARNYEEAIGALLALTPPGSCNAALQLLSVPPLNEFGIR